MLITLSGLDGAGKTTLAGRLTRALSDAGVPVWRTARADTTVTDFFAGITDTQATDASPARRGHLAGMVVDEIALHLITRLPALMTGRQLVLDRYGYDALVHCAWKGSLSPRMMTRVATVLPRPGLALYLECSPHEARTRSSDAYPAEYFEAKSRLYDDLFAAVPHVRISGSPARAMELAEEALRECGVWPS